MAESRRHQTQPAVEDSPANGVKRGRRVTPVALRVLATVRDIPLPVDTARFAIGSDPAKDLVLDDRYVSGFHCLLERTEARRVVVRDRGSRNGTFVNGNRVRDSDVEIGQRILIGTTALGLVGRRPVTSVDQAFRLVGEDARFRQAIDLAVRAARTSAPLLILGESGTGKELVARLIHESSLRAVGPLVTINCGAIPRDLVESELFGHERGAFTGATERRLGLFEQAAGGTLFLDEIGELPREQQPRLLRVLETHRIRRVGGESEREVDVRIVAATHRDLRAAAGDGFRMDLYHRLATVEIVMPPLRERASDIPLLVAGFLADIAAEYGARHLRAETLAQLTSYAWPGNVRELRNAIVRAATLSDDELRLGDLLPVSHPSSTRTVPDELSDGLSVDDMMRAVMGHALERCGSYRRAADAVGMSKSTFHDRARRYGLR